MKRRHIERHLVEHGARKVGEEGPLRQQHARVVHAPGDHQPHPLRSRRHTRPTLGLVGEAGPEAVIPLSRAGGLGGVSIGAVHIHGNVDSRERVDEFAEAVAGRLISLAGSMGPLRYR